MKDLFLEIGGSPVIVTVPDKFGQAVVNGRTWRWEYSRRTGPVFLRADGEPRVRWPGQKHSVWVAFNKWLKKEEGKR